MWLHWALCFQGVLEKVRTEWDGLPDDHAEKVLGRLEAAETQAKAKAIQWSVWSTVGSLQF